MPRIAQAIRFKWFAGGELLRGRGDCRVPGFVGCVNRTDLAAEAGPGAFHAPYEELVDSTIPGSGKWCSPREGDPGIHCADRAWPCVTPRSGGWGRGAPMPRRRVPRVVLNPCPVAVAVAARVEDDPWHPPTGGHGSRVSFLG